jgi:hypothetical protein
VVGEREVIIKAAGATSLRRGRCIFVKFQIHFIPPSALHALFGAASGDVES